MLTQDQICQTLLGFGAEGKYTCQKLFGIAEFFLTDLCFSDPVEFVKKLFQRIAGYSSADLSCRFKASRQALIIESGVSTVGVSLLLAKVHKHTR